MIRDTGSKRNNPNSSKFSVGNFNDHFFSFSLIMETEHPLFLHFFCFESFSILPFISLPTSVPHFSVIAGQKLHASNTLTYREAAALSENKRYGVIVCQPAVG